MPASSKRRREASAPPPQPALPMAAAAAPSLDILELHARFPPPKAKQGRSEGGASPAPSPVTPLVPAGGYYTRSAPHRPRAQPAPPQGGAAGGAAAAGSGKAQRRTRIATGAAGGAAAESSFLKVCTTLSTWAFVGAAEPLGIFGECTPATYTAYARAWRAHGLGGADCGSFFHMGSGLGVAVFAARLVGGAAQATGVEWNGHAVDLSERVARDYGITDTRFLNGSYMDLPAHLMDGRTFHPVPQHARFLYAFDLNYVPRKVGGAFVGDSPSLHVYVHALNAQRKWRYIHTCIPLDVWRAWGLVGTLTLQQTLTGKMKGSGSGFTSFILQRTLP